MEFHLDVKINNIIEGLERKKVLHTIIIYALLRDSKSKWKERKIKLTLRGVALAVMLLRKLQKILPNSIETWNGWKIN